MHSTDQVAETTSEKKKGLSEDKLSYRFEHRGKSVTMFRRNEGWSWQIKPKLHGKQRWIALDVKGTSRDELALAVKRAKFKLDELEAIRAGLKFEPPKPAPAPEVKPPATIGELLARYEKTASAVSFRARVEPVTVIDNAGELRRFLRWAYGTKGKPNKDLDVDALNSGILDGDKGRQIVERFLANYLADVETPNHRGRNELAVDRRTNGASHMFRKIRSVFAKNKRELFQGLQLPDLTQFLEAARMPVQHSEHQAITPETIADMDAEAAKLRDTDKRMWLVHLCLKHLALRPKELHEARMDWLREAAWGQWFFAVVVTATSRPKASLGYTPVPREVAETIVRTRIDLANAAGETLTDGSPLIPGESDDERGDVIYRDHSNWMRKFVPKGDYHGSNYELRRWAIQTIRSKYGKDAASDFGRHAPRDVTQQHYLERMLVWRDRVADGNAGITFADARGRKMETAAGEAPRGGGWQRLISS